jgi:hypothetical protein
VEPLIRSRTLRRAVFVDTSAWYALADTGDTRHALVEAFAFDQHFLVACFRTLGG